MSRVLTNEQNYYNIADTIRQMKNVNTTYKPREMASALKDIYSNEVEGTLPLSFEANGNSLLNYRIDGASGGVGERTKNLCPYNKVNNSIIAHVESGKTYSFSLFASFLIGFNLMKRNASSQSTSSVATKYNSEGNVSATFTADEDFDLFVNGFSTISGKTFLESVSNFQLEESSTATDYEPYGYKVPVKIEGKNLANWDRKWTISANGTVISDQNTISCIIDVRNINNIYIYGDTTKLNSGIYRIGKSDTPIQIKTQTTRSQTQNNGVINVSDCNYIIIACGVYSTSTTFDDIRNEFMVVEGTTEPSFFEPYYNPQITNIYLDSQIYENESISLSDTNVNIPTIEGTNILTVDTTVQPSNVYIQAPKDSDEIIEIINTLEAI